MQNLILVKDVLKLVQPISEKDSTAYYQKYRCPVRWLEHFSECYFITNFEFIRKLDGAFRPIFEDFVGRKLDWHRIFISIVPYHGDFNMYERSDNRYLYVLTCSIGFSSNTIIDGNIIWYVDKPSTEIDFYNLDFEGEIIVEWIPEDYSPTHLDLFLDVKPKFSNLKFKSKLKFPVFSWMDSMPHEGKFGITLIDNADKEKVSYTLEGARAKWNALTDHARETGDATLERGYCHTITFDGIEDNIAYWYIDVGSAHDGIHEFLLKELSDSGIKIKLVEIQML